MIPEVLLTDGEPDRVTPEVLLTDGETKKREPPVTPSVKMRQLAQIPSRNVSCDLPLHLRSQALFASTLYIRGCAPFTLEDLQKAFEREGANEVPASWLHACQLIAERLQDPDGSVLAPQPPTPSDCRLIDLTLLVDPLFPWPKKEDGQHFPQLIATLCSEPLTQQLAARCYRALRYYLPPLSEEEQKVFAANPLIAREPSFTRQYGGSASSSLDF